MWLLRVLLVVFAALGAVLLVLQSQGKLSGYEL